MNVLQVVSHSEAQTESLGNKLAERFVPGDVVVLKGRLGSGKTVFVRGLATGCGLDADKVSSPSFTFVNEYPGEKPLYHFDFYRMTDEWELQEIGWNEYLNRNALVVAEWGERVRTELPQRYYLIEFKVVGETEREISISLEDRRDD
jgi:tRNA threonylcarbamoyladenosine biosynthesis protein TsaE